jgi:hypothetical protein
MSVEKTPRACISTGTVLSRFGKPLLYFLVCGVVDRPHQYHDLFSLKLHYYSIICFFTTTQDSLIVRVILLLSQRYALTMVVFQYDYTYAPPNQRYYASRP